MPPDPLASSHRNGRTSLKQLAPALCLPYNSSRVNGFKQGELSETLLSMVTRKQKESDIRFG